MKKLDDIWLDDNKTNDNITQDLFASVSSLFCLPTFKHPSSFKDIFFNPYRSVTSPPTTCVAEMIHLNPFVQSLNSPSSRTLLSLAFKNNV